MELSRLLLTGSLSGLISILAYSAAASGVEMVRGAHTAARSTALETVEAFLHMVCGAVLGAIFWLSWGFAAIVDVAWWVRGLAFAGLCWTALIAPVLLDLALAGRLGARTAGLIAARWAMTCTIAGLACAWMWQEGRL